MLRSFVALCVVGALVIGCVSIETVPTAAPSLLIPTSAFSIPPIQQTEQPPTAAPTPTAAPESTPTQEPTSPPTDQPTDAPTGAPPPTPAASPSGVDNYGAHNPVFDDQMEDPNSGWGTGTNDGGTIAYVDGNLQIDAIGGGAWLYTSRLTGSNDNAAHFEGVYTPAGTGYMGLACGDSDDVVWGARANLSTGEYAFLRIDGNGPTVLSEGVLDALRLENPTDISRFALDCAGTATGAFRMQIYPAGENFGAHYDGAPGEGPATVDRVVIYAESLDQPYSLTVDYLLAYGGDGDTSPSPEEVELMSHVPVDWQPNCFPAFSDVHAVGATANVFCQLFHGRSTYASYDRFDTKANMDAYFQYLVAKYPVVESGSCETGPHLGGYTIGDEPAGQLLCTDDPLGGTRLFWTHDDLLILGDLDDDEGSYPDMYSDWLEAGPN